MKSNRPLGSQGPQPPQNPPKARSNAVPAKDSPAHLSPVAEADASTASGEAQETHHVVYNSHIGRNASAPNLTAPPYGLMTVPQRPRAQSDVVPLGTHQAAPKTLRAWRALCAPALSRAQATLGSATQLPALTNAEQYSGPDEEAFVYHEASDSNRQVVGINLCVEERDLNAFHPERLNSILKGLAEGKKFPPIHVDKKYEILNGGHRWLAAQLLGLQTVVILVMA